MSGPLRIVVLGLTVTSSWGNGHATTYRALLKAMAGRGHAITFLERDMPWYAAARDLATAGFCDIRLYRSQQQLHDEHAGLIRAADAVIVGSCLPDGIEVARWAQATAGGVRAFYDIDTPVTLGDLQAGTCSYLDLALIPGFDLYLSFAGGPVLDLLEQRYGARRARALYCSVDTEAYQPQDILPRYDLAYLGTYSADRQPMLQRLLIAPAEALPDQRFAVAGPQYPDDVAWPANVARIDHLPPADHPAFYAGARFTLNVTRQAMVAAGWSPSVRLFEAAACGVPIISDDWPGLGQLFRPEEEILIARTTNDVAVRLQSLPEGRRQRIATRARARVLAEHSAERRAEQLESALLEAGASNRPHLRLVGG